MQGDTRSKAQRLGNVSVKNGKRQGSRLYGQTAKEMEDSEKPVGRSKGEKCNLIQSHLGRIRM